MLDAKDHSEKKTVFTREEVSLHNTEESCWLIVRSDVYDVTAFLRKHPAGADSILRHAGTDATTDFDFHSRSAQKMWCQYKIGTLGESKKICLLM